MKLSSEKILYDYATRMVGLPYIWGGDDTVAGYDCSGLIIELLKSVDMYPVNSDSNAQGLYHRYYKLSISKPKFGTLIFYGQHSSLITHVAFALNDKLVLEAGGGGRNTKTEADAIKQNAYVRIRPLSARSDIIAFLHPKYEWETKWLPH